MAVKDIPAIVKHMTLAIYASGDIAGSKRDKFFQCFTIARSQLHKNGYITSAQGKSDSIHLTGPGMIRNKKHLREGTHKNVLFDALYEMIAPVVDGAVEAEQPSVVGPRGIDERKDLVEKKKLKNLKGKAFGR